MEWQQQIDYSDHSGYGSSQIWEMVLSNTVCHLTKSMYLEWLWGVFWVSAQPVEDSITKLLSLSLIGWVQSVHTQNDLLQLHCTGNGLQ